MKATIQLRDVDTNEVLETFGTLNYSNTGTAIQQCKQWYNDEIMEYLERGYHTEIVLVDISLESAVAAELGRKGGSATSAAKAEASRANGRKGGRPRKRQE